MEAPMIYLIFMAISCILCKNNEVEGDNETLKLSAIKKLITTKNIIETTLNAYLNPKVEKEIDGLLTDNYVLNMNGIPVVTHITEFKARLNLYETGFPDSKITLGNSIVCDNQGYVDWIFTGIDTGRFTL